MLLAIALSSPQLFAAGDPYREITWRDLAPKGWDPAKELKALDLSRLDDSDPRAIEALQKIKAMWDAAPTEPSLQGKRVRLPGYAIPLERKGDQVTEFLLVPYFGACIHTPPPPANQIVHGLSFKALGKMVTMDAVWVSGTINLQKTTNPWGASGYQMVVDKVAKYKPPPE